MHQNNDTNIHNNNSKPSRLSRFKKWLGGLSFRTGIIVLILCVLFYILSFAQMLLPISLTAKGILWTIFFGLAKTAQYTAILIIGKEGIARLKQKYRSSKK